MSAARSSGLRQRAQHVLCAVEAGRFAADLFVPGEHRFVRELVLGVLRRRLTLDTIHDAFGRRTMVALDADVRTAVRIGLYQLFFMDAVPDHAAVSESVRSVTGSGRAWVNGVLRAVLRGSHTVPVQQDRGGARPARRLERAGRTVTFFARDVLPDPQSDRLAWLACLHSHPPFLVRRWVKRMGEAEAVRRMQAANHPATVQLRARAGRVSADELVQRLQRENLPARVLQRDPGAPAVEVSAREAGGLFGAAWRAGLFAVQAADQMDAAEVLAPRPGEVIWDACAAPGGKACQLAELLAGAGQLVATDRSAARVERLVENRARLGLQDSMDVAVFDLESDDNPPGMPAGGFDAVLLDAPCSNTAVLGPRPEARWRLQPDTFEQMARVQAGLLQAARRRLRPGGRLVYATCSLEPEEGAGHGLEATRSALVWSTRA